MIDTRQMTCELCKRSVPISEIKYMLKGQEARIAVCASCREKTLQAQKGGPMVGPKLDQNKGQIAIGGDDYITIKAMPKANVMENIKEKKPAGGKLTYKCGKCSYVFKADPDKPKKVCPYCGRPDKISEYQEE